MSYQFYIVDVFAEQSYSGNQLAVVIGERLPSEDSMQKIAAEMNFSETTFVTPEPEENGGYRVRIFTPSKEIAFAGHPILGTAQVLRNHVISESSAHIKLNLSESQVPVTFEISDAGKEIVWFSAPEMLLGAISAVEPVATALGISSDDIEMRTPIQVVSAGTSAMIIPLRSLDALRKCMLNIEKYSSMLANGFPPLTYLFTQQTYNSENDLCVRFFFESHGVREDPATGNGAAFLGAYLLEHQYFPESGLSLRIEQGYEVRRPSLIMLRAKMLAGIREVYVGGYVVSVVEGKLL
ncbi:MAG: PhzF family phenazine biosynthesis isomerase [Gammaproteobacteria bacterium]|nr:MAG: PhzF family phenazine biosynthesis isomerase [Gammaproteobacteria bacterium]